MFFWILLGGFVQPSFSSEPGLSLKIRGNKGFLTAPGEAQPVELHCESEVLPDFPIHYMCAAKNVKFRSGGVPLSGEKSAEGQLEIRQKPTEFYCHLVTPQKPEDADCE